jgi:hypothetical protein
MALSSTFTDRPQVKHALVRVWRDPDTLQLGSGSGAWVIRALTPALKCVLDLCDGTRPRAVLLAEAEAMGVSRERVAHFLAALTGAGVLEDAGAGDRRLRDLSLVDRERLEPERAALSLSGDRPGGTAATLAGRARAWVEIDGEARVIPLLAALFAAAGVGHVTATSTQEMTVYDAIPGGPGGAQLPRAVVDSVVDAVAQSGGTSAALPPHDATTPDLRVLAERGPVIDPVRARIAMADGVPVLAVHARELIGVVGPLVVAGVSACLHCLDLHRVDRDQQWPLVAAQLASRRLLQPQPVSLLAILAGHAVAQGLALLDGDEEIATHNGTLEISAPDWRVRRRGWAPHPECGCIWPLGP